MVACLRHSTIWFVRSLFLYFLHSIFVDFFFGFAVLLESCSQFDVLQEGQNKMLWVVAMAGLARSIFMGSGSASDNDNPNNNNNNNNTNNETNNGCEEDL